MKTLYHMVICPLSRQIRFLMHEKKLDFRLKEEKVWQPSARLLVLNPSGVLPALEDGINTEVTLVIGEYAIFEYLEEGHPNISLIGATPLEKNEVRRLCHWFNTKFYQNVTLNLVFEKIIKRQAGQGGPDSSALRQGRAYIHEHLEYISWLCDRRKWLAGAFFSMADIAAAAHLSTVDYLGDVPWDKYTSAKEWYTKIKSRPTFRPFLSETVSGVAPAPDYSNLDF